MVHLNTQAYALMQRHFHVTNGEKKTHPKTNPEKANKTNHTTTWYHNYRLTELMHGVHTNSTLISLSGFPLLIVWRLSDT